jgi:hypothetical protein
MRVDYRFPRRNSNIDVIPYPSFLQMLRLRMFPFTSSPGPLAAELIPTSCGIALGHQSGGCWRCHELLHWGQTRSPRRAIWQLSSISARRDGSSHAEQCFCQLHGRCAIPN